MTVRDQTTGVPRDQPHWYRITADECPICGRYAETRERVAGEKPEDPDVRYDYVQGAACVDHFL